MDICDFLAARIHEDKEAVREFDSPSWHSEHGVIEDDHDWGRGTVLDVGYDGGCLDGFMDHAARWDPARVRLECDAKTGILLDYMTRRRQAEAANKYVSQLDQPVYYTLPSDLPLKYLALPYRDHPDWKESWLPPEPGAVELWGRR